ncbi:MAG: hypothetical protein JXQ29_11050 [Planctomycetes bacterium]|nr:hypothetical protein [Planctomycetota bacterium]
MRTVAVWVGLALVLSGMWLGAGCAFLGSNGAGDAIGESEDVLEIRRLTEAWLCEEPYLNLDEVGDIDLAKLNAARNAPAQEGAPAIPPSAVPISSRVVSDIRVLMAEDAHEALALCREETTYMIRGTPVVRAAEITAVYERTPDGWQLVHVSRVNPDQR